MLMELGYILFDVGYASIELGHVATVELLGINKVIKYYRNVVYSYKQ